MRDLLTNRRALIILALLTLAMFWDVLFFGHGRVLSDASNDLFHYFVHWREFGFRELRSGNFPLWNPHYNSGSPFFGGFQSALLYPPNILFLVLPLAAAINWSIALHVYLAGAFTFLWGRNRGLSPVAALLAGVIFMFSGPYFLHIFAGHLPNLCTMVWAPLLFLSLDLIFARPALGPCLLGIFAASMSILAGHVQYVYYLACIAFVYSVLNLWRNTNRTRTIGYLLAIGLGTIAITAVQLFTGIQEASEGLRQSGLSYENAAEFSFPPENLLTMIAPWFFGDMKSNAYWGRCFLFESSLFVSVTGLVLAIYGGIRGHGSARRISLVIIVTALILALGNHTPLFNLLYYYLPGFNKFRGNCKFIFIAALFTALLAGIGLDELFRSKRAPRALAVSALLAGILICCTTVWLSHETMYVGTNGRWSEIIRSVQRTGEIYVQAKVSTATFLEPEFPQKAGGIACQSFVMGGLTLILLSICLFLTARSRRWIYAVVLLTFTELFFFAHGSLETFPIAKSVDPQVAQTAAFNTDDSRIFNLRNPNMAMSVGVQDVWGDDPGGLRRYAEFIGFTQGIQPESLRQFIPISSVPPCLSMVRCKYVFPAESGEKHYETPTIPLPRFLLVDHFRLLTNRIEILTTLTNTTFNPREEVVLESVPNPLPEHSADAGTVKLLRSSTDFFEIEASTSKPQVLLITDAYSRYWRVHGLGTCAANNYQIQPANYCLQAVALGSGQHRLRFEYEPSAFAVGKWISILSSIVFCALTCICVLPVRRKNSNEMQVSPAPSVEDRRPEIPFHESEPELAVQASGKSSKRSEFDVDPKEDSARFAVGVATIAVLICLAYIPSFTQQFLWDDDTTLYQNPLVLMPGGLKAIWFSAQAHSYWPVTYTSLWAEWRLWGDNAVGYRIVNVMLHVASCVLLWRVLRRLRIPGSWWAALIWGLHPVCVGSVAWIAEQKNTLSLVFYLLTILFYLRTCSIESNGKHTQKIGSAYALSLLFFLLALLSKSSVVPLPFVLILCLWWIRRTEAKPLRWADCLRMAPFFALSLGFGILTVWFQQHRAIGNSHVTPVFERIIAGTWSLWFYLGKLLVPMNLSGLYHRWTPSLSSIWTLLPGITWVAFLVTVWRLRKRVGVGPLITLLYFTACLAPVLGLFNTYYFTYSWVADHWQYLASIGIVVSVVSGCYFLARRLNAKQAVTDTTLACVVVCLVCLSWQHASVYGSSETLWKDVLNKDPESWVACNNLGNALDDQNRANDALPLFEKAVELNPDYVEAHNNLGALCAKLGRTDEALQHYTTALRIYPDFAEAHNNLGGLLIEQGKLDSAKEHFLEAVRLRPDYADAHYNLGTLLEKEANPQEALQEYLLALRGNPAFVQALYNAGTIHAKEGNYSESAQFFRKAIEIAPNYAEANFNLGLALHKTGREQEANLYLSRAVLLKPELNPNQPADKALNNGAE